MNSSLNISPGLPEMSPEDFVAKWRGVDFGEKQASQEMFLDICDLAGHPSPVDYGDKEVFTFEKWVPGGFADAYLEGSFGWEFKGSDAELPNALLQLLRYQVHLKTPPLLTWMNPEGLLDHSLTTIARNDDYNSGMLQSRNHELWASSSGTQFREVESGCRYTPTTCFETFPFPKPTEEPRAAIAKEAEELNWLREGWLNPPGVSDTELKKRTLTNLYNARPTWLQMVHERLDKAVLDAYGWPHGVSEAEILERLLALNLERAAESAAHREEC